MKDSSEKFMSFILNFGLLTARITLFFIFAWRLHPKSREGKDMPRTSSPSTLRTVCRLGDEERRLMHLVPAPAVRELAGGWTRCTCTRQRELARSILTVNWLILTCTRHWSDPSISVDRFSGTWNESLLTIAPSKGILMAVMSARSYFGWADMEVPSESFCRSGPSIVMNFL